MSQQKKQVGGDPGSSVTPPKKRKISKRSGVAIAISLFLAAVLPWEALDFVSALSNVVQWRDVITNGL